jgi:hypothetical protein
MPRRSSKLTAAEARLARQWPGLSRHRPLSSFPRKALEQGAKVEAEHVGDYMPLARRIAADHLVEDPRYYEKIKKYGLTKGRATKLDAVLSARSGSAMASGTDVVWKGNVARGKHVVGELSKGPRWWGGVVRQSFGPGHVLDTNSAPTKAEVKELVTDLVRKWDREIELQGREAFGLARGLFPDHRKGDPTRGNFEVLAEEIKRHEERGDKTLHRFYATSLPHIRRLLKAGYLAPAPGYPRGHWLVTGQAQMILQGLS